MMAILAIALHAVLWAVAPLGSATSTDPFSVICHNEAAPPVDPAPDGSSPPAAHPCDHCNICSAAPTLAALDSHLSGRLAPTRLIQILRPVSTAIAGHLATPVHFARGPPSFA